MKINPMVVVGIIILVNAYFLYHAKNFLEISLFGFSIFIFSFMLTLLFLNAEDNFEEGDKK